MIGLFRPNFHITIADIFQDYNDPRKGMLSKRVEIALEEQERRLKCEIDANNLANLQILLKKQQVLKHMQQLLEEKQEELQDLLQRTNFLSGKVQQLQGELLKKQEAHRLSEQKFKQLVLQVKNELKGSESKSQQIRGLQKEREELVEQRDKLQEENRKYLGMIGRLRESYNKKVEETEYLLKIKQSKMKEEFQHNLQQMKNKVVTEKQKKQIESKLQLNRAEVKSQRIQCSLLPKESPRKIEKIKHQIAVQTQDTKEKAISDLIEKSQAKDFEDQQNLNEVRLLYKKSIGSQIVCPQPSPKLTKYFSLFHEDRSVQTEEMNQKETRPNSLHSTKDREQQKVHQSVEVNIVMQDKEMKEQLQRQREKNMIVEAMKERAQAQLEQFRLMKDENMTQIQKLRLNLLQVELQLDKKNHSIAMEREVLTRTNKQLQLSQNQLMLRKLSGKTELLPQKPNFSQTCSILYSAKKQQFSVAHSTDTLKRKKSQQSLQESVMGLSPRKWADEEVDVITVIRKANNLKVVKAKRSMTQEGSQKPATALVGSLLKRNYKKYSKIRPV